MLTTLKLGNFKAFADTQRIPIKPLTLIYGANSAGKSSIIHSLILARHAIETGELDVILTKIGGEAVDLGGFKQYIHQRNTDKRVEFEWEISSDGFTKRMLELLPGVKNASIGVYIGLSGIDKSLFENLGNLTPRQILKAYIKNAEAEANQPEAEKLKSILDTVEDQLTLEEVVRLGAMLGVEKLWLDMNGKRFLSLSSRSEGKLRLDLLDTDHEIMKFLIKNLILVHSTTDYLDNDEFNPLLKTIDELVPEISFEIEKFLPKRMVVSDKISGALKEICFVTVKKETRFNNLKEAITKSLPRILEEILISISDLIEHEFNKFTYLGSLRTYPPRHITSSDSNDRNWIAGGGSAWDTVRKDSTIRKIINDWLDDKSKLSTPYELTLRYLLTVGSLKNKIDELTSKAVSKLYEDPQDEDGVYRDLHGEVEGELAEISERLEKLESFYSEINELALLDKRSKTVVSHRDVGIGISQVLPVLVTAFASKEKIIAMEQPELHLHPALQAELADVFIDSAVGDNKNTLIIETHSEHLLLRIMRRMRETYQKKLPKGLHEIHPEDVSVLFVEPDGARSIVREMPLNERGELVKAWPGGFFEEGFKELF